MLKFWYKYVLNVKKLGSGWDAGFLGVLPGSKLFSYATTVAISRKMI